MNAEQIATMYVLTVYRYGDPGLIGRFFAFDLLYTCAQLGERGIYGLTREQKLDVFSEVLGEIK